MPDDDLTLERIAELRNLLASATDGDWGAMDCMVTTPKAAEQLHRIESGESPFTCRRIALFDNSTYIPPAECASNAVLCAEAKNSLAALLDAAEKWLIHTGGRP